MGAPRPRPAEPRPRRWALRLLVCAALALAACGGAPPPDAVLSTASAAPATPTISDRPPGALPSAEQVFADGWLAVVEAYDREATDLLIANPLAEYDLVGVRLIEVLDQTRQQLSAVAPPARLREEAHALDDALGETLALLRAIEPHGPRTDQAAEYQRALDDWVDHVRPHAQAIRDALELAPVPPGDLQL